MLNGLMLRAPRKAPDHVIFWQNLGMGILIRGRAMKPRSALISDLFAADSRAQKIDSLGGLLVMISEVVDFAALAGVVDRVAPRLVSGKGVRRSFPTETMVRILVLNRLHHLSGDQVGFQLPARLSFQRFCGLTMAAKVPDLTTVLNFENRIGASGAPALFDGLNAQLLR